MGSSALGKSGIFFSHPKTQCPITISIEVVHNGATTASLPDITASYLSGDFSFSTLSSTYLGSTLTYNIKALTFTRT